MRSDLIVGESSCLGIAELPSHTQALLTEAHARQERTSGFPLEMIEILFMFNTACVSKHLTLKFVLNYKNNKIKH